MTAPTYRRAPIRHAWQTRIGRWDWEITDGIGGTVLAAGSTWTRAGAQIDSGIAQVLCRPAPALVLEQRLAPVVARLDRQGLRVEVHVDERMRVCVTPLCACSDRAHRRIMCALTPVGGAVRWEVP